jgi:hypothetical protein
MSIVPIATTVTLDMPRKRQEGAQNALELLDAELA